MDQDTLSSDLQSDIGPAKASRVFSTPSPQLSTDNEGEVEEDSQARLFKATHTSTPTTSTSTLREQSTSPSGSLRMVSSSDSLSRQREINKLFYPSAHTTPPGGPNKDRKSTRLNSSHSGESRMPSSA